jgi:predicted metal-dependent peptidase
MPILASPHDAGEQHKQQRQLKKMTPEQKKDLEAKAMDTLRLDIICLVLESPFVADILAGTVKTIEYRAPVACVTLIHGDIYLGINPFGYLNYPKAERLFILHHELLHLMNKHFARFKNNDPGLFNIAADTAINQLIETSPSIRRPEDCCMPEIWDLPVKLSAEMYYDILWKRDGKIEIPDHLKDLFKKFFESVHNSSTCPTCNGTGEKKKKEEEKEKEMDKFEGIIDSVDEDEETITLIDGKVISTDSTTAMAAALDKNDQDPTSLSEMETGMAIEAQGVQDGNTLNASTVIIKKHGPKLPDDEKDDEKEGSGEGSGSGEGEGDSCPDCGGSGQQGDQESGSGNGESSSRAPDFADMHPTWKDTNASEEKIADSVIRNMVQQALRKNRGNIPGYLEEMAQKILESKIDWRSILRNFVAKRRSTLRKQTWKRENRRLGDIAPGYKKYRKLSLVVAIDTSGSVSNDELSLFEAEIKKIHRSGADITIIECDARIHSVYKYTKTMAPTFKGRGGTDFRPVFEYINKGELRQLPDAVIFLTDGEGPAPDKFGIPTLWVLTPTSRKPYSDNGHKEISWGHFITIQD